MNIIDRIVGRTPRPKITSLEAPMAKKLEVKYVKGSGKNDKAVFTLGNASVPVAVISRIYRVCQGKSPNVQAGLFYKAMHKKYSEFLMEIDKNDINYFVALETLNSLRPQKASRERTSKVGVLAKLVYKTICKRFKGTPSQIVQAFKTAVLENEFEEEVLHLIETSKAAHGESPTGHIKTSARKANPKALAALQAARLKK